LEAHAGGWPPIRVWPLTVSALQLRARLCPGTTSTGGKRTRESCLALNHCGDPGAETKGQAGACPDWTRAIPCEVQAVTAAVSVIRNTALRLTAADWSAAASLACGQRA